MENNLEFDFEFDFLKENLENNQNIASEKFLFVPINAQDLLSFDDFSSNSGNNDSYSKNNKNQLSPSRIGNYSGSNNTNGNEYKNSNSNHDISQNVLNMNNHINSNPHHGLALDFDFLDSNDPVADPPNILDTPLSLLSSLDMNLLASPSGIASVSAPLNAAYSPLEVKLGMEGGNEMLVSDVTMPKFQIQTSSETRIPNTNHFRTISNNTYFTNPGNVSNIGISGSMNGIFQDFEQEQLDQKLKLLSLPDSASNSNSTVAISESENTKTLSDKPDKKEEQYMCLTCSRKFTRQALLKSHQVVHKNEREHVCVYCKKAFARRHDMLRHERTIHSNEKLLTCMACKLVCTDISALEAHYSEGKCNKLLFNGTVTGTGTGNGNGVFNYGTEASQKSRVNIKTHRKSKSLSKKVGGGVGDSRYFMNGSNFGLNVDVEINKARNGNSRNGNLLHRNSLHSQAQASLIGTDPMNSHRQGQNHHRSVSASGNVMTYTFPGISLFPASPVSSYPNQSQSHVNAMFSTVGESPTFAGPGGGNPPMSIPMTMPMPLPLPIQSQSFGNPSTSFGGNAFVNQQEYVMGMGNKGVYGGHQNQHQNQHQYQYQHQQMDRSDSFERLFEQSLVNERNEWGLNGYGCGIDGRGLFTAGNRVGRRREERAFEMEGLVIYEDLLQETFLPLKRLNFDP